MLVYGVDLTLSQVTWILLSGVILVHLILNRYGQGLNNIPGPAVASLSNLWRFFNVWTRRPEQTQIRLHERYGDIVRIGPNTVSIADPKAVQVVYRLNSGLVKSDFYTCQQTVSPKGVTLLTLFTSLDEKFHAKLRRSVASAYALSTLVQFEPLVDSTTTAFLKQLEQRYANRSGPDGICDFGAWLQYYAFDVIGELTFSKRLGFVDEGKDIENIITNLEWLLNYAAVVGQIPFLDSWLLKNPLRLWLGRIGFLNSTSPVAEFARSRIFSRANDASDPGRDDTTSNRRDFLSRFLAAHEKDPDFISNDRVLALTVANMFAGSDTTAITLRAIFYFLMKHPSDLKKLQDELEEQQKLGLFTGEGDLVRWNEVRELPFLNAVVKEGLRCHPAVGLLLERVVPPEGLQVSGHYIPGGTVVGINAWVLHRNQDIFGKDAAQWRPSRWIEASAEKRREMDNTIFSFGAGARTCIGKNISLLELYKLVPAVLRRFEIEFSDPQKQWGLHNAWFVRQKDFHVRLRTKPESTKN